MVFGRKLSRGRKSREALFRSLIRAIVLDGKIETTLAKAKAVRGQIDKIVTLAKKGTLATRRRALAFLGNDRATTDKLFKSVAKVFAQRSGGYTRIILLPSRRGDAAKMARIEWVEKVVEEKVEKVEKKAKKVEKITKKPTTKKVTKKTIKKETKK